MWQVGFEPSGEESGGGDAEGGDDEEWQADALPLEAASPRRHEPNRPTARGATAKKTARTISVHGTRISCVSSKTRGNTTMRPKGTISSESNCSVAVQIALRDVFAPEMSAATLAAGPPGHNEMIMMPRMPIGGTSGTICSATIASAGTTSTFDTIATTKAAKSGEPCCG